MSKLFSYVLFFSLTAQAKFDVFLTGKLNMPDNVQENSTVVNLSNKVVSSIDATDNSKTVVTKIVDNSVMYWWDNSGIRNTSVGKAVDNVQNKMRADVNLGSTGSDSDKNATQHKLSMKILAAQALAKIEYYGWFKAAFTYDAKSATSEAAWYENLNNNKDLIVSHSINNIESRSQVSLRWNW
ncbi:MAG: hypothetical protein ACXVAX_04425 [Pseudobdellovibrio sp.]